MKNRRPTGFVLWLLIDVADILWSFLSLSDSYETGSEFSSHFTGLPCPLSVLLNAFTFAQSTHAPLTPLWHSPADDREVEEVEEVEEEEEEEEEVEEEEEEEEEVEEEEEEVEKEEEEEEEKQGGQR